MISKEKEQANFEVARLSYGQATRLIEQLSSYVKRIVPEFSFDIAMEKFDIILQGIILKVAMSPNHLLDDETQVVNKIIDNGKAVAYFNSKGIEFSREFFFSATRKRKRELVPKMLNAIYEVVDNFIIPFAIIDFVLPIDLRKLLIERLVVICLASTHCNVEAQDLSDFKFNMKMTMAILSNTIKEKWEEKIKIYYELEPEVKIEKIRLLNTL